MGFADGLNDLFPMWVNNIIIALVVMGLVVAGLSGRWGAWIILAGLVGLVVFVEYVVRHSEKGG